MTTNQMEKAIIEMWRDCKGDKNALTATTSDGDKFSVWMDNGELRFTDQFGEIWEVGEFAPFELLAIYAALIRKFGRA